MSSHYNAFDKIKGMLLETHGKKGGTKMWKGLVNQSDMCEVKAERSLLERDRARLEDELEAKKAELLNIECQLILLKERETELELEAMELEWEAIDESVTKA